MKAVLQDVQYAPAEVYGISLHGHGTGWFRPNSTICGSHVGRTYIERPAAA